MTGATPMTQETTKKRKPWEWMSDFLFPPPAESWFHPPWCDFLLVFARIVENKAFHLRCGSCQGFLFHDGDVLSSTWSFLSQQSNFLFVQEWRFVGKTHLRSKPNYHQISYIYIYTSTVWFCTHIIYSNCHIKNVSNVLGISHISKNSKLTLPSWAVRPTTPHQDFWKKAQALNDGLPHPSSKRPSRVEPEPVQKQANTGVIMDIDGYIMGILWEYNGNIIF